MLHPAPAVAATDRAWIRGNEWRSCVPANWKWLPSLLRPVGSCFLSCVQSLAEGGRNPAPAPHRHCQEARSQSWPRTLVNRPESGFITTCWRSRISSTGHGQGALLCLEHHHHLALCLRAGRDAVEDLCQAAHGEGPSATADGPRSQHIGRRLRVHDFRGRRRSARQNSKPDGGGLNHSRRQAIPRNRCSATRVPWPQRCCPPDGYDDPSVSWFILWYSRTSMRTAAHDRLRRICSAAAENPSLKITFHKMAGSGSSSGPKKSRVRAPWPESWSGSGRARHPRQQCALRCRPAQALRVMRPSSGLPAAIRSAGSSSP